MLHVVRRVLWPALAGLVLCAPRGAAQGGLVEAVEGANPLGSVAVIGPLERPVTTVVGGDRVAIPGLSTGVHTREGDALEITVSGETFGDADVDLYALVDGGLAEPGIVRLRTAGDPTAETRSFTFVVPPGLAAGRHVVVIEWYQRTGAPVQMRDRALTVQAVGAAAGRARLAVAHGRLRVQGRVTAWTPVPDLETTLVTEEPSQLAVTFSAELDVDGGRFFARAVVDGAVLADALMAVGGVPRAPRSFTFVLPELKPGLHDVRIEYTGEGGSPHMWGRSLAAFAAPRYVQLGGGMSAGGVQAAPITVSSSAYVDIPSATAWFWSVAEPASAIVSVGAELRLVGGGRLFFRPVVDDRYAQPGDVAILQGSAAWRASSFSFALKNLKPGLHSFRLQAAVDPGSTAFVGDHFWRLVHKRRSGAEFAQPLLDPGLRYTQQPKGHGAPLPGHVICLDPRRPAHPAPTFEQLEGWYWGFDGEPSVGGWFDENAAGGQVSFAGAWFSGCGPGAWRAAPAAHQGNWYWDNQAWETMFADALTGADPQIDYHGYDRNHDGELTPDEALITIVHPQNAPDLFLRAVDVLVDGGLPLRVHFSQLYASADEARRRENVGLIAHERALRFLGAEPLHGCPAATAPGVFSMLATRSLTHLDPWHKLHSALVTPALLDIATWETRTLDLPPVSERGELLLLYNRARGDAEYFVIEQRAPALAPHDDPAAEGVVVWHLFDNGQLAQQLPPPGGAGCSWAQNSVRKLGVLRAPGDVLELKWGTGAAAGIAVRLGVPSNEAAQVEIIRLP